MKRVENDGEEEEDIKMEEILSFTEALGRSRAVAHLQWIDVKNKAVSVV